MAVENINTIDDVIAHFKGTVTEYWVKTTARKLGIGTRAARKLTFTDSQLQRLITAHALPEATPKRAPAPKKQKAQTAKPKPTAKPLPAPAGGNVTELRARPERARSYGKSA